jgi:hypothetical protein
MRKREEEKVLEEMRRENGRREGRGGRRGEGECHSGSEEIRGERE